MMWGSPMDLTPYGYWAMGLFVGLILVHLLLLPLRPERPGIRELAAEISIALFVLLIGVAFKITDSIFEAVGLVAGFFLFCFMFAILTSSLPAGVFLAAFFFIPNKAAGKLGFTFGLADRVGMLGALLTVPCMAMFYYGDRTKDLIEFDIGAAVLLCPLVFVFLLARMPVWGIPEGWMRGVAFFLFPHFLHAGLLLGARGILWLKYRSFEINYVPETKFSTQEVFFRFAVAAGILLLGFACALIMRKTLAARRVS